MCASPRLLLLLPAAALAFSSTPKGMVFDMNYHAFSYGLGIPLPPEECEGYGHGEMVPDACCTDDNFLLSLTPVADQGQCVPLTWFKKDGEEHFITLGLICGEDGSVSFGEACKAGYEEWPVPLSKYQPEPTNPGSLDGCECAAQLNKITPGSCYKVADLYDPPGTTRPEWADLTGFSALPSLTGGPVIPVEDFKLTFFAKTPGGCLPMSE